ncbi:hypothetical protein BB561_002657 [Smittium simulii]|uniref:Uncharacterized protein n=1 Tax=Smittium simulii TaxID=133385 RepID=A0A2T9YPL5_9FUNG|nr:hypothetical protein BB561_002657 [Smittium simulii]
MQKLQKENLDEYKRLPLNSSSVASKPKLLYDPNSDSVVAITQKAKNPRATRKYLKTLESETPKKKSLNDKQPNSLKVSTLRNKIKTSEDTSVNKNGIFNSNAIKFMDNCTTLINSKAEFQASAIRRLFLTVPEVQIIGSFGRKDSGKSFVFSEMLNQNNLKSKNVFNNKEQIDKKNLPLRCFINHNFQVILDYPSISLNYNYKNNLNLVVFNILWSDTIVVIVNVLKNLLHTDEPLVKLLVQAREKAINLTKTPLLNKKICDPKLIVVFNSPTKPTEAEHQKIIEHFATDAKAPGIVSDLLQNNFNVLKYMYLPFKDSDACYLTDSNNNIQTSNLSNLSKFWLNLSSFDYKKSEKDLPPICLSERSRVFDTTENTHFTPTNYNQSIESLRNLFLASKYQNKSTANSSESIPTPSTDLNEWLSLAQKSWELILSGL